MAQWQLLVIICSAMPFLKKYDSCSCKDIDDSLPSVTPTWGDGVLSCEQGAPPLMPDTHTTIRELYVCCEAS